MKTCLTIFSLLLLPAVSIGQQNAADSLRKIYYTAKDDSALYKAANQLYDYYGELNRDSAFFYADQCVQLSRKNNRKLNEAYSLSRRAYQEINLSRFAEALHSLLDAFFISENTRNEKYYWEIDPLRTERMKRLYALSCTHHIFALLMRQTQNLQQEAIHFREAKRLAVEINNADRSLLGSLNLGRVYLEARQYDSAMACENEAEEIARVSGRKKYLTTVFLYKGLISMSLGDSSRAIKYFYESIRSGAEQYNLDGLVRSYHAMTIYHIARGNRDSSLYYATRELDVLENLKGVSVFEYHVGVAYESLYKVYQLRNDFDSAFKYLALAQRANDSISRNRIKSLAEFQQLTLNEQQRLQNVEKEKVVYRNRIRTYFFLAGIAVLLLLAFIFYRNNRQKQKANVKIEKAYQDLKATQQQLVQSEKMASLGELTAGIAHEIQNPLNFVNNFSEVNTELIDELEQEANKGNLDEVKAIARDIKENEEKINHHGKRADAIVKGMLQHSRSSSSVKEPTDINALCDEYLRLAYHGLKAKDKSFNATIKKDFDGTIGNLNLVPQDIGRVILNLINNAFYAVDEKKKSGDAGYEPAVSVSTKRVNGKPDSYHIEIRVADNGKGIPQKVLDKIFQPFFTTKPTGQGTGLGLSLSYDIIKAHGGEIKVNTGENKGAEFVITLPI